MKNIITLILTALVSFGALAGEILLSFDDAPMGGSALMSGEEKTEKIIQGLKSQGVNDALFFVTSRNIDQKSLKRIERYTNEGFHLANHSHMHISANKNSTQRFLLDFYQSHLIIKDFKNYMKLHRFPYLHYGDTIEKREAIYKGLKGLNYGIGYVTVDNFDWYLNGQLLNAFNAGKKIDYDSLKRIYIETLWDGIKFYDNLAKKILERSPKHILLLHENEIAALFVEDLIRHIKNQNWKIISPKEAYQDPISNMYNSAFTFNKQGRIAAIAHAKGIDKKFLRHKSESETFLNNKLKENKVFK